MNCDKKLYFAKVKPEAKIPEKLASNAGYDIYPCFEEDYIIIQSGETKLVPTGIASACDENYYFQIQERGSSGSKGIKYSAGVIDSSYRGEWFLATTNTNNKPVVILKADLDKLEEPIKKMINEGFIVYPYSKALFQAIVHCIHNEMETEEISFEALKEIKSERGDGKLGSSGK